MPRDPEKYLHEMLDSSTFLLEFSANRTLEEYKSDRAFRSAVERELLIIGEALFQLERHFPYIAHQISEAERIIRFRHVLVHGYATIQHDIVWAILQSKLSVLHAELKRLLEQFPS
jgi:uncharacterized protein with HEPN domain